MSNGTANSTNNEKYCKKYLSVMSVALLTLTSISVDFENFVFHKKPTIPSKISNPFIDKDAILSTSNVKLPFKISTSNFTISKK